jgi:hypothetical protein
MGKICGVPDITVDEDILRPGRCQKQEPGVSTGPPFRKEWRVLF